MNPEQQQQRIMTYFIEEAQEHLQTIEQGVLSLQDVLADVERINELFRAAHSIKGGAAMLDIGSIQHISHRLEDYFKILKDNTSVQVDEKLKSLFLAGCDRLQELLDYLQENYTIAEELATAKVTEVEPVFSDLESHLNALVAGISQVEDTFMKEQRVASDAYNNLMNVFQEGVANELRNMLQLFKQEDTQTTRQQLQDVCDRLLHTGNNLDNIGNWHELISASKSAISNLANPYLNLAQVIIRDIRQAQDLVLAQRSQEIAVSEQLQALIPVEVTDAVIGAFTDDLGSFDSDEEFFNSLGITSDAESEEFLLEEDAGNIDASTDDFELDFLEADDLDSALDDALEDNTGDLSFNWDEPDMAPNEVMLADDISAQFLENETSFDDLLEDADTSVSQNEGEFFESIADPDSFLQEEVDLTFGEPIAESNDIYSESVIEADTNEFGLNIDQELDQIDEGSPDRGIYNPTDNLESLPDFEDEFDLDIDNNDSALDSLEELEETDNVDLFADDTDDTNDIYPTNELLGLEVQDEGDSSFESGELEPSTLDFVTGDEEDYADSYPLDSSWDSELDLLQSELLDPSEVEDDVFASEPGTKSSSFDLPAESEDTYGFAKEAHESYISAPIDNDLTGSDSTDSDSAANDLQWDETSNLGEMSLAADDDFEEANSSMESTNTSEETNWLAEDSWDNDLNLQTDDFSPEPTLVSADEQSSEPSVDALSMDEMDDELSAALIVDELVELEALGFDLDDEEEDDFAMQGLAASGQIINASSTEEPDSDRSQLEFEDGDLELSNFFAEADDLVDETVSEIVEQDAPSISAVVEGVPTIDSDRSDSMPSDENIDVDFSAFNDTNDATDDGAASIAGTATGSIGEDLDAELEDFSDLFAATEELGFAPSDSTEELSLFAETAEESEYTSAQSSSDLPNFAIAPQEGNVEDDVSVLDALDIFDDRNASDSDDADLASLFADDDVPEDIESAVVSFDSDSFNLGSSELISPESTAFTQEPLVDMSANISTDISTDLPSSDLGEISPVAEVIASPLDSQDADFGDFSDLLELGADGDSFLSGETAELIDVATEPLVSVQPETEAIASSTLAEEASSVISSDNLPDIVDDIDNDIEDTDITETVFIDDAEDMIGHIPEHHSDRDTINVNVGFNSAQDQPTDQFQDTELHNSQPQAAAMQEGTLDNMTTEDTIAEGNDSGILEVASATDSEMDDAEQEFADLFGDTQNNLSESDLDDREISEILFDNSERQDFGKGSLIQNVDLADLSDLDDEFSSISAFIEKNHDPSDLKDDSEISGIFGLTEPEGEEGDGGVKKSKGKQPDPTSPNDHSVYPSGIREGEFTGTPELSRELWEDRNMAIGDISSEMGNQNSPVNNVSGFTSPSASVPPSQTIFALNDKDDSSNLEIFDELEAFLNAPTTPSPSTKSTNLPKAPLNTAEPDTGFDDLEALIGSPTSQFVQPSSPKVSAKAPQGKQGETDDFDELEMLLRDTYGKEVGPVNTKTVKRQALAKRLTSKIVSQTMKVDVKHLDSLNNLVGELVVNRNLLEQDQEKLQQFISNLLFKVQQLGDVAQRMRDQYDRSLLESSIMASRPKFSASDMITAQNILGGSSGGTVTSTFEDIEFDRYNSFHILSQEIIELVVRVRESAADIEFVVDETAQVSRQLGTITTQVQDDLKQVRMVPFAQIADRLPRAVRDLAFKTGKQADLEMHGRETLIDKAILEQLYDPMTHLVNNAIVHGLEEPGSRQTSGKPAMGKITVRAFHQGNQTVISISDDGAGISTEKVKQSAVKKGLYTQSEVSQLSDNETYDLLFEAGFSTKLQADEFAGRGVGLDVVRTALNDIRGSVHVDSSVGTGTTFTIRLPLTLSISKAMFCVSDRAQIAFPIDGFEDMIEIQQSQVQLNSKGQPCLPWRDTILPFQPLSNLLSYNRHINRSNIYGRQDDDVLSVIILRSEGNYLALQVDQFLGENEIVIKQLEGPIPKPAGIAGATILGDGKVMAIASVLELFDIAAGRLRPSTTSVPILPIEDEKPATDPTVLIVDDSITVRELLSLTFSKVGYRVEQARDGQDAWEKLRAGLPCNLIFCDIEMPRMDGLELLSRLQKDEFLSQIPVAMLTSRGADRHRQTAVQLGAKGYFTKPYLEEEILSSSQRMLNGEVLV